MFPKLPRITAFFLSWLLMAVVCTVISLLMGKHFDAGLIAYLLIFSGVVSAAVTWRDVLIRPARK